MTILHAHSDPQFTEHLRSVLAQANGQPHSVDIAVGYFYLSGLTTGKWMLNVVLRPTHERGCASSTEKKRAGPMSNHKPRDKATVSRNMAAIKRQDSTMERCLASAMWKAGLRYRKQYPVTGRPDFAFPRAKIAVFCDSEFWHGYDWNEVKRVEFHTNRDFWVSKIERNIARDQEVNKRLSAEGWVVLRFWGDEIKVDATHCVDRIKEALNCSSRAKQA